MRRLLFVCSISIAAFTPQLHAQPQDGRPQEVVAVDTIQIRTDQTRTFMLDQAIGRIALSSDDVALVTPETDRTVTIKGLKPGSALLTFYAPDGHVIHRSNISVEQSAGVVRIYGGRDRGESAKDYLGFYCTSLGCGRADPDKVPPPRDPSVPNETTITETRQRANGESTTVRKSYDGAGPPGAMTPSR